MSIASIQVTRRRFGQFTGAALASTAIPDPASAAEPPGYIDAHVHVWTPDTTKYPLDTNFDRDDMRPASFVPEQLFQHTKPADVNRIVLIQMSFYNHDNSYMLDMMAKYPAVFSGVGIVDHHSDTLDDQIRSLVKAGVRGIRIHARGGEAKEWPQDAGMRRLWEIGAREGVAICPLINPSDLPYVETLSRRHRETTVVVDHFARVGISGQIVPSELDNLCRLANVPTVHVKTSAFYALGQKRPPYKDLMPMIRRVIDAFGPDRLMWASDCPYQVQGEHTYEASLALIRDAAMSDLSGQEKNWLLRGTAEKVFF